MSDPLVTAIEAALSDTVAWRKPAYLSDTVQSLIAAGEYRKAAEVMAPRIRALVDVTAWWLDVVGHVCADHVAADPSATRVRREPLDPAVEPSFVLDPNGPYVLLYSPAIERHADMTRRKQLEDWERGIGRPEGGWAPMPGPSATDEDTAVMNEDRRKS